MILKVGSKGGQVRHVQQTLTDIGIKTVVDGAFGAQTKLAVGTFQEELGLTRDGLVGPHTFTALVLVAEAAKSKTSTDALLLATAWQESKLKPSSIFGERIPLTGGAQSDAAVIKATDAIIAAWRHGRVLYEPIRDAIAAAAGDTPIHRPGVARLLFLGWRLRKSGTCVSELLHLPQARAAQWAFAALEKIAATGLTPACRAAFATGIKNGWIDRAMESASNFATQIGSPVDFDEPKTTPALVDVANLQPTPPATPPPTKTIDFEAETITVPLPTVPPPSVQPITPPRPSTPPPAAGPPQPQPPEPPLVMRPPSVSIQPTPAVLTLPPSVTPELPPSVTPEPVMTPSAPPASAAGGLGAVLLGLGVLYLATQKSQR